MTKIDLINYIVLGSIMFGIGTSLSVKDFQVFGRRPLPIVLGLVTQMILMPLVYFLALEMFDLSPELSCGIMILALCPGGVTSNFVSYLFDLETALSVSLTTINSLLVLITIPLGVNFFINYYGLSDQQVNLDISSTSMSILAIIAIPLALGLLLNNINKDLCEAIQKYFKFINVVLLAVVFGFKIFGNPANGGSGITLSEVYDIITLLFFLQVANMIISYLITRYLLKDQLKALTIMVESALQNSALALLITAVILSNNEMSKPAIVSTIFSFPLIMLVCSAYRFGSVRSFLTGQKGS